MMKMKHGLLGCTLAAGLAISAGASAYDKGDFIVRAGYAALLPNESGGGLSGTPINKMGVDNAGMGAFTLGYMITRHVGLELVGSVPFLHHLEAPGSSKGQLVEQGEDLGKTRVIPPTALLQFYPYHGDFQPYAGVGVTYAYFYDESSRQFANDNLGGKTKIDIGDSVGPALQVGADYDLSSALGTSFPLMVGAMGMWSYVKADAKISTHMADGTVTKRDSNTDLNPFVFMVSAGTRF
jgi:outer membrane protein